MVRPRLRRHILMRAPQHRGFALAPRAVVIRALHQVAIQIRDLKRLRVRLERHLANPRLERSEIEKILLDIDRAS